MSGLLQIDDLRTYYPSKASGHGATIKAVDGVSLTIERGRTMGLVGESGCGKSTLGRTIMRLSRATSGHVTFDGQELLALRGRRLRDVRRQIQMVFQDPFSSLDPRMRVKDILAEPIRTHRLASGPAVARRVNDLLDLVGLRQEVALRFPHEFSGWQRQRIGIARALAVEPAFLVCDEPVSALDASVQAQILNLIEDLRDQLGLTCLFIAHDLSVVRHICSDVAVMYLGKIVEIASRDRLFGSPLHPYTNALLSAVPIPDPVAERNRQRTVLTGDVPSAANPPSGCRFNTRCPLATDLCRTQEPALERKADGHLVACHLVPASRPASAGAPITTPSTS